MLETVLGTVVNYIGTVSFGVKVFESNPSNKNVTVPTQFTTVPRTVSRTVPTVPRTVPRTVLICYGKLHMSVNTSAAPRDPRPQT